MTSPAQIDANRANAQQSTGPATTAGKSAVRFNAMRHGLTSQVACMTWEDREAFDKFCVSLIADYRPEGDVQYFGNRVRIDEDAAAQHPVDLIFPAGIESPILHILGDALTIASLAFSARQGFHLHRVGWQQPF